MVIDASELKFSVIDVEDKECLPAGTPLDEDDFIIEEGCDKEEQSYAELDDIIAMHCDNQYDDTIPFDNQSLGSFGFEIQYGLGAEDDVKVFYYSNSGGELDDNDDVNRIKTIEFTTENKK